MTYDLTIKTSSDTIKTQINTLQELKEIITQYDKSYTEVKLTKVKINKTTCKKRNNLL